MVQLYETTLTMLNNMFLIIINNCANRHFCKLSIITEHYEILNFPYSLTMRQQSHRNTACINLKKSGLTADKGGYTPSKAKVFYLKNSS